MHNPGEFEMGLALLSESADQFYKGVRPGITMAGIGVSMHPVLQLDNSAHLSRAFLAHNCM